MFILFFKRACSIKQFLNKQTNQTHTEDYKEKKSLCDFLFIYYGILLNIYLVLVMFSFLPILICQTCINQISVSYHDKIPELIVFIKEKTQLVLLEVSAQSPLVLLIWA